MSVGITFFDIVIFAKTMKSHISVHTKKGAKAPFC